MYATVTKAPESTGSKRLYKYCRVYGRLHHWLASPARHCHVVPRQSLQNLSRALQALMEIKAMFIRSGTAPRKPILIENFAAILDKNFLRNECAGMKKK